ncbi:MAG: hypothetical protein K2Z81_16880 [Cyanobacteria bacterium]|nr:hypothetical protein [Cyanobacteriota bacterium]
MEKHMNGRLEEGPDASPNSVPTKLIEEAISTRQEAAEILLHNFKPIDADEDGFLSEDELLTVSNRQDQKDMRHSFWQTTMCSRYRS